MREAFGGCRRRTGWISEVFQAAVVATIVQMREFQIRIRSRRRDRRRSRQVVVAAHFFADLFVSENDIFVENGASRTDWGWGLWVYGSTKLRGPRNLSPNNRLSKKRNPNQLAAFELFYEPPGYTMDKEII
uniref:Uncharacterized protein n=1 Tax=Romanomermis culicivorax TaxID=13658 RepID=A0A915J2A5_ROMCU